MIETLRVDVAGVPVFVAPNGPRVPVVGMTFRVGRADETAATSGLSHLVEHLALPATTATSFDFNGTVEPIFTTMYAAGHPSDIRDFVATTAGLLKNLPPDRFEPERRTLLAEEAIRGGGGARLALALRYGPVGHGLPGYDEYGLRRLEWPDVESWTSARFTKANAALWLAGAAAEDVELELDLPAGERRHDPPFPRQIGEVSTPAIYASGFGVGVCLSFVSDRTPASRLGVDLLADALRERLRYELGLSYSIATDYQGMSAESAHVCVTADVTDEHIGDWLHEATSILEDMAAGGPSEAALRRANAHRKRYDHEEATAAPSWVATCAEWELVGLPVPSHAAYLADYEAVTSEDVAQALAAMRPSLLVLGPDSTPVPDGFEEYPLFSKHRVHGRRHRPASFRDRLRRDLREVELFSSAEGVTNASYGRTVTAIYESVVVCIREPGERTLLTDDGFFVTVVADAWTDGEAILREIDVAVPDHLVVADQEGVESRRSIVEDLAATTFKRTWLVRDELAVLPAHMDRDEQLLVLATASRGWRFGLVALTDRRLTFLYGDGTNHSFVVDRDSSSVRATGDAKLEVLVEEEWITLSEVGPAGKAREVEQLFRG